MISSMVFRTRLAWLVLLGAAACTSWRPPAPPPGGHIPPPPPTRSCAAASTAPRASAGPSASAEPSANASSGKPGAPSTPAQAAAEAIAHIDIERPYKLGERPVPTTSAAYQADILERRRWNTGGLGELRGKPPGPEGHPDPRVIINVVRVRGPHRRGALQRVLRRRHWIAVVRCYRLGAYKDRQLRGWTHARLRVSRSGRVSHPRLLGTELGDEAVAKCMVARLSDRRLPSARAASRVDLELRVGPGDEPLPPPDELIVPGDGKLAVDAVAQATSLGRPAFEACYRQAFDYAPALWGRMVLRFHLTAQGTVDEVFQTESRFPAPRVVQCVLHHARGLKFPQPIGGDLRFEVPLRFDSDRSAAPHRHTGARPGQNSGKVRRRRNIGRLAGLQTSVRLNGV